MQKKQMLNKNKKKNFNIFLNSNAVTSLISLILILLIYFSSIGVVFIWGIPAIDDMKDNAQKQASVNNFEILNSLVEDLIQSGPNSVSSIDVENTYDYGSITIDSTGDRLVSCYTVDDDYNLTVKDIKDDEITVEAFKESLSPSSEISIDNADIYYDTCFLAGTKVFMSDGSSKNIEDVCVGDNVKSYDFDNNHVVDSEVSFFHVHSADEMDDYYLVINDDLCVTPNHLFFTDNGWVCADDLDIGDKLLSYDDNEYIGIISIDKIYEQKISYDLSIKEFKNYFVKSNNDYFLVHNSDTVDLSCIEDIELQQTEGDTHGSYLKFSLEPLLSLGEINILDVRLVLYVTDISSWEPFLLVSGGGEDWGESANPELINEMLRQTSIEPILVEEFIGDPDSHWSAPGLTELLLEDFNAGIENCSLKIEFPDLAVRNVDGISGGVANKISVGCLSGKSVYFKFLDRLSGSEYSPKLIVLYEESSSNNAPNKPSEPSPSDRAKGVSTSPTISVTVTDPNSDSMNVRFYGGDRYSIPEFIGEVTGVISGRTASVEWSGLEYSTEYVWNVSVTDGEYYNNSDFWSFTTGSAPPTNTDPVVGNNPIQPLDENEDTPETSPGGVDVTLQVGVLDADDDDLTVKFYDADVISANPTPFNQTIVENTQSGNIAEVVWHNKNYAATYNWYVTVDDEATEVESNSWSFTTVANQNPNADNDAITISEQQAEEGYELTNLLNNDEDADGHSFEITDLTQPPSGEGSTEETSNDVITYTSGGFTGETSFTYTITDDFGGDNTATVTIFVSNSNSPPDIPSDPIPWHANESEGIEDQSTVEVTLSIYVYDSDDDLLNVSFYVGNEDGLNIPSPQLIDKVNNVNSGDRVSIVWSGLNYNQLYFWYVEVSDDKADPVSTSHFNFTTIQLFNQDPVANDDYFLVPMNCNNYQLDVLFNDTDPDKAPGDYILSIPDEPTQPSNGTTAKSGNYIIYTGETDFIGETNFTYNVSDEHGGIDTGQVFLTVTDDLADFNWYDTDNYGSGSEISFTALYDMESYSWDLGDGSAPLTEKSITYDFYDYDSHTVCLNVTDVNNNIYSECKEVYASIKTNVTSKPTCVESEFYNGTTYTFKTNLPAGDEQNGDRNYSWDFDGDKISDYEDTNSYDGTYSDEAEASYSWDTPGIYFVRYKPNYLNSGLTGKWSKPMIVIVKEKKRFPDGFSNKISSINGQLSITHTNSYKIEINSGDPLLKGTVKIDLYSNGLLSSNDIPFASIWILDLGSISFSMNTRNGEFISIFENNAILTGFLNEDKYITNNPDITYEDSNLIFNLVQIRNGTDTISGSGKGMYSFDVEVMENPINDAWSEDAKNIKAQFFGENKDIWEDYLIDNCGFLRSTYDLYCSVNPNTFQFFVSKIQISLEGIS